MKETKEKRYSSSFIYPDEEEFYRTKQAAAACRMPVTQYILQAVMKENTKCLGDVDRKEKIKTDVS